MSDQPTAAPKPKATKKPKFKVGDYVTRPDWVYLRVVAALPSDNTLYALVNYTKKPALQWLTEFEVEQWQLKLAKPDFECWKNIAVGDMIQIRDNDHSHYRKVLARIGDAVMLSEAPVSKKQRDTLDKLAAQVEELTSGVVEKEELLSGVNLPMNTVAAYKTADAKWTTVDVLAHMHWTLIRQDEGEE